MQKVVEYNVTDAALAKMESDYMALVVKDLDDKKGFDEVHKARMVVKGVRVDVEKKRKELKADALEWGRKVDAEAKRIFGRIEPIERHLTTEEEKVTKEFERRKIEEERKRQERAQGFVDALAKVGVSMPFSEAIMLLQADFDIIYKEASERYAAEQARIAEEKRIEAEQLEAERKARAEEAARLAAERAELDRIRAEENKKRQEEQALLKAERDKLDAERRALEIAMAKKEAAERAIREAKEQAEREAREKSEAEQRAKEESERQERLKPDKEKLKAYASTLMAIGDPKLQTEAAQKIMAEANKRIIAVSSYIVKSAKEL